MVAEFIDLAVEPDALRAMLVRHGLVHTNDALTVTPMTGGVSSNILRVVSPGAAFCVKQALPKLRVQKDWFAPVTRVFAEIAWLEVAAQLIPSHVPRLLVSDSAVGAFVMEYLPPEQYFNWKSELLAGRCDPSVGTMIGTLLGKFHQATAHDQGLAARFANDATFFALRLEPYLVEASRQHPTLTRQLDALVQSTQTHIYALVHGDVSPKNILLGPDGPLLLDAECAWYGDPAFDLAFLLNHVLLKSAHLAGNEALHVLYHEIVASYLPQVQWESSDKFERRTAALLPGLLLARIDGKSPVEYLNYATQQIVRTRALAMLYRAPATLSELLQRFVSTASH